MENHENPGALKGLTAVVVEDDGVAAGIVAGVLDQHGMRVDIAGAGSIALQRIQRSPVDVVICDVHLPDCSGLDVARTVRQTRPEAVIVMVTGDRSFDTAVKAIRADADDYVSKPIVPEELVAVISKARSRRGTRVPGESVLAIGAHPDDVEIGCGGMLLAHVARGDTVTILTLSQGAEGGDSTLRGEESRAAADLLGATLVMHDLKDTAMEVGRATIDPIIAAIEASGAGTIYTHTDKDVHQDHRAVNQSTLVAAREVPRVYTYQAPSTSADFFPTKFEDISGFLDQKIALIDCYATQADRSYLEHELLRSTARYWARFARGTRYVEAFDVLREASYQSPSSRVAVPTHA